MNQVKPSSLEEQRKVPLRVRGVAEILERHREWLDSGGEAGVRADLSHESLEGADLIDARLTNAQLNQTNLKRADLILADLRGASLLQANFEEANLLGTQFQQANLQAAVFKEATGLVSGQFAGANLFGAMLPEPISPAKELKHVSQLAARTAWLLAGLLAIHLLAWVRIFTTRDAQLLKNAPVLPFSGLQADLPFIPFYLFGPVAILGLYVWFHLYLQRLWDGASQLPAIFPDGSRLDARLPWFARWPAQTHCKWLQDNRSPLAFLEAGLAIVLLYWITPVTALLFWGRYLTLEDLRGSVVQVLLVAGSVTAAMNFPRMAGKAFRAGAATPGSEGLSLRGIPLSFEQAVPGAVGVFLVLLSAGIAAGVPHDQTWTADAGPLQIKSWAGQVLWLAGVNPFGQLAETDISARPAGWSGREEDLSQVTGAVLNRRRLQYIQAYGAFFAKARLRQADLRHAQLSETDLRAANLRGANLRFAILDNAKLKGATLQESDLRSAILTRADLREATLSSANLSTASLLDAVLDGANLYKSDLHEATLQRASLKLADLREANANHANLTSANLQEAYLSSTKLQNAQLKDAVLARAILTDADLRNSNLRGANLQGAVLGGADLSGADLQGADLLGAVGLTARQICSAASFAEAQWDENFQQEIAGTCASRVYSPPVASQANPVLGIQPAPRSLAPAQLRAIPAR
jgi:uncharacterized protein YjbI with pentapeptide repeats